jgi:hypothetical protein
MPTEANTLESIPWSLQLFNNHLFPHTRYKLCNALEYLKLHVPTSRDKRLICHSTELYCFDFVLSYAFLLCDLYLYVSMHVQTLSNICSSYVTEGPAQVKFCASRNWIYVYGQLYMCIYRAVLLKSKLQSTGTWSAAAWPSRCLCYRLARKKFEAHFTNAFHFLPF